MEKKINVPALRFRGFDGAWEKKTLEKESTEIIAGGDIDKNLLSANGKYPVIANALSNEGIVGYYEDEYRIAAPAVTVTGRGDIGHAVARKDNFTPVVRLLSIKSAHDVDFLSNAINQLKIIQESTGVPQLTVPQLAKQEVFFPLFQEEEIKIGMFLTCIDDFLCHQQEKIKKLEQFRQAMLTKLFPAEGASKPALRFRGFSGPWKKERLGNIVDIQSGQDYKNLGPGTIPVYGTGGYMLSVDHALSYDKDAIGIGRKGTIDKPYILHAPFWTVDTLFYVLPQEGLDLNFAYAVFQKINWKALDESTGVPSLSKINIGNVVTYFPTYLEQQKIGNFFHWLDSCLSLQEEKLNKLRLLKSALLDKLFV